MPKSTKLKVVYVRNQTDKTIYATACDYSGLQVWISRTPEQSNHLGAEPIEANFGKPIRIRHD